MITKANLDAQARFLTMVLQTKFTGVDCKLHQNLFNFFESQISFRNFNILTSRNFRVCCKRWEVLKNADLKT